MNLPSFRALLTPLGQRALSAATALAPTEESFLACLTPLQKQFDSELAKAALETAILRRKARAKFVRAEQMYFVREALEQASGETIARYRAERFAPFASVADLGCGLGGDALALAAHGTVAAVDIDPLRLALAEQNLAAYGVRDRATFICDDVTRMQLPRVDAFFFDPARRAEGRRKFSIRDYTPPLSILHQWLPHTPAIAVKISPGVDLEELDGGQMTADGTPSSVVRLPSHEKEFISVNGELKECVLWFGPLATATRRATLLPGRHSLILNAQFSMRNAQSTTSLPLRYLYEPDPAILRAGLVTTLAEQLGAQQMDEDIAYLTSDALTSTPFARAFAIEEAFPFQLKRLRERLRALRVGAVTVKKRGSPLEPEALIHQLKLSGPEQRIVFLTHVRGAAWALIGNSAMR